MANSEKNLFELMEELSTSGGDGEKYKYCSEQIEKRRAILKAPGTPYFEEIKQRTKGIRDKLKKEGYEDIDLQIKSLFIDGIRFFCSLTTDEPQLNNDKWKYLKGLFDAVGINTDNKELLEEIKSELSTGGGELPPSPIDFLVNHQYSKSDEKHRSELENKHPPQERIETSKKNDLQRIIRELRGDKGSNYVHNVRIIRQIAGQEDSDIGIEYDFLNSLHGNISTLLNGNTINQLIKDNVFDYYNIDINDREGLELLKRKIELRLDQLNRLLNRLEGKEIMKKHRAYDDSRRNVKEHGGDLVMYHVGDEYIPDFSGRNSINSIELLEKVNSSNYEDLEKMFIEQYGERGRRKLNQLKEWGFSHKRIIRCMKRRLLRDECPDIVGMYNKWRYFEVVRDTYKVKERSDLEKKISCWYIDICPRPRGDIPYQETGKVYRVLSR